jgi:hypothetical protein
MPQKKSTKSLRISKKLRLALILFILLLLISSLSSVKRQSVDTDNIYQQKQPWQEKFQSLIGKSGQKSQTTEIYQQESPAGFFEIKSVKANQLITNQEEVEFNIYLTSTGQEFDLASALVTWDDSQFEFASAQAHDLPGSEQALNAGDVNQPGSRVLTLYAVAGDQPITTTPGQPTLAYTLTLKAKKDQPAGPVNLGSNEDLALVFIGSTQNAVRQDLASQDKLAVNFTTSSPPADSPPPTNTPSFNPTATPTIIPTATPFPTKKPLPSPTATTKPFPTVTTKPTLNLTGSPMPTQAVEPALNLKPGKKYGWLSGYLTDSQTGEAISEVLLTAEVPGVKGKKAEAATTHSTQSGYYEFRLETGEYLISTKARHYRTQSQNITVLVDQTTSLNLTLDPQGRGLWGVLTGLFTPVIDFISQYFQR